MKAQERLSNRAGFDVWVVYGKMRRSSRPGDRDRIAFVGPILGGFVRVHKGTKAGFGLTDSIRMKFGIGMGPVPEEMERDSVVQRVKKSLWVTIRWALGRKTQRP